MIPVFDSNIVIDFLNSIPEAYSEHMSHDSRYISMITWIEVMAGIPDIQRRKTVDRFLRDDFTIIHLDDEIAELAAVARREMSLKLPDAIIFATAKHHKTLLVTRNSKDFSPKNPHIRIPYQLRKN